MLKAPSKRHGFGTFAGVFTPSVLTILGVIMFMRAGFVIGQAGILRALLILVIAEAMTLLTALSLGAISTNTQVRGGGAYFLISRSLGPEFGGAIGLALFLGLTLSVPFYILGFTESLVRTFPGMESGYGLVALSTSLALFLIAYFGAAWAIRVQYVIMAILGLAIVAFLGGAALRFSPAVFSANLSAGYTALNPSEPMAGSYSFWLVFAIYFPAVTGINAGLNMSGDLKDPARSIPAGTLAAVTVGFLVYGAQILLCGGAYERGALVERPFGVLVDGALVGAGPVVVAGVFAATLSSALGSYLTAPRVLQAVARDPIVRGISFLGRGTRHGDEPRRALVLVGGATAGVLVWAMRSQGEGALDAVAAVITMLFLYSYGMTNLAAFVEDFGGNPSFRPRFRLFHWSVAAVAAIACTWVAFLIHWIAATAAVGVVASLYGLIRMQKLRVTFGDARHGFVYASVRRNLIRLARIKSSPKNWRPTILAFCGAPESRSTLVHYASWLESGDGIVILADVMVGTFREYGPRRAARVRRLLDYCDEEGIQAFPQVAIAPGLDDGISILLQTSSMGPLRPNIALLGWPTDSERITAGIEHCRAAASLGMNPIWLYDQGLPAGGKSKRIDLWWRGQRNGALMAMLAHQLVHDPEWARGTVRFLRVIENPEGRAPTQKALEEIISRARLDATAKAIVSRNTFRQVLLEESSDAACVFLGFVIPEEKSAAAWYERYEGLLAGLPTTLLVQSIENQNILD